MAEEINNEINFDDVLKGEEAYIQKRRSDMNVTQDDGLKKFIEKIQKLAEDSRKDSVNNPETRIEEKFIENIQEPATDNKTTAAEIQGNKIGLALSGGGIRSATFNLGILQSLAKSNILKYFDYLSTVSGGGYIGSCISSLLDNPNASTDVSGFPFRFDRKVKADERKEVKWLRQYGNYLFPNGGLFKNDTWCFIALLITGVVLVNIPTFYLSIFIMYVLHLVHHIKWIEPILLARIFLIASLSIVGIMILFRAVGSMNNFDTTGRNIQTKLLGWLAITVFFLGVMGGLIILVIKLPEIKQLISIQFTTLLKGGTLATIGGLATGLLKTENVWLKKLLKFIFYLALAAILPVIIAFILKALLMTNAFNEIRFGIPVTLLIAMILVIISFIINPEKISLHHFYRNRLSKAYIIKRNESDPKNPVIESNEMLTLSELHKNKNGAPYQLINCTVNLPSSQNRWLRGRGGDFFLFSKLFSGSDSTGYCETKKYKDGDTRLATAMAISGAAASPQAGMQSSPVKGFLFTLLNIRLNRWMLNPNPKHKPAMPYLPYYYLKELLGVGEESDGLLNLSDGGHIENLGIYQLLKRRCDVIVASDSGADPTFNFEDLANMLAKARMDLGIEIKFNLKKLRQDAVSKETKSVVAFGEISYPEGSGLLIYIKSSITGDEPEDILAYRRVYPMFPHQSTGDQFFDESQFESYRALGYFIGKKIFP